MTESPNDCAVEPAVLGVELVMMAPDPRLLAGLMRVDDGMLPIAIRARDDGPVEWRMQELDAYLHARGGAPSIVLPLLEIGERRVTFERPEEETPQAGGGARVDRLTFECPDAATLVQIVTMRRADGEWRTLREMHFRRVGS